MANVVRWGESARWRADYPEVGDKMVDPLFGGLRRLFRDGRPEFQSCRARRQSRGDGGVCLHLSSRRSEHHQFSYNTGAAANGLGDSWHPWFAGNCGRTSVGSHLDWFGGSLANLSDWSGGSRAHARFHCVSCKGAGA